MKTVSRECKKCHAASGKSYLGPVLEPDEELAIRCEGKTRIGEPGILCAAVLVLRCIQTPVNHVLDDNRFLLKIASFMLFDSEGEEIELEIKRVLSINEPSRVNAGEVSYMSSNFPGTVELQQLKFDIKGQKEYLKHIDNNGFKIVTGLDKRVGRGEDDVNTLHSTVGGFRESIRGVEEGLKRLKSELNHLAKSRTDKRATLKGLKNQLSSTNNTLEMIQQQATGLAEEMREEVSDLKNRILQTKQELDMARAEVNNNISTTNYARPKTVAEDFRGRLKEKGNVMRFEVFVISNS
ncbi:hypothetical protein QBC36DRAFT_362725 [Triangularia setosa]|uniref:Uncharacterized protein n=1 Tax=Triangularia setosa TaxID=2587417 RepID=A0AAN6W062_9PEZI|nr:hypothetical protein QBC36DRAFT_362725 [Podospora setosa]